MLAGMTDDESYQALRNEIIEHIKSRLGDNHYVAGITIQLGWDFYLGTLDTLLQFGQTQSLKHEIDLMRAELTKLENQIQ